jgi:hypothetical protein
MNVKTGATMNPSLAELTSRFLNDASLWESDSAAVVEPYDVPTAFRVDPRTAWAETRAVYALFGVTAPAKIPMAWIEFVRDWKPVTYVPMAIGTFPQMVSDLSALLAGTPNLPGLTLPDIPGELTGDMAVNQAAAEHWLAGRHDEAEAMWIEMPDSPLRSFNIGMSALAKNNHSVAKQELATALLQLPIESGWRALAELYIAVAKAKH